MSSSYVLILWKGEYLRTIRLRLGTVPIWFFPVLFYYANVHKLTIHLFRMVQLRLLE